MPARRNAHGRRVLAAMWRPSETAKTASNGGERLWHCYEERDCQQPGRSLCGASHRFRWKHEKRSLSRPPERLRCPYCARIADDLKLGGGVQETWREFANEPELLKA